MNDFAQIKAQFHLPDNMIYLDGNSLGAMPNAAVERVQNMMHSEWSQQLIKGWNNAGWFKQPNVVGDRVATLIGAKPGTVVMGDTLSVKVYQALSAALELNPNRKIILSDNGNFPSDLYIAQGLTQTLKQQHKILTPDPHAVESMIDDSVAVLLLTHVDYRTGRLHDMQALSKKAQAHGVITVWDLAHSAGAVPLQLDSDQVDFAVGCTYKYLNGGPGSPAFIYVSPDRLATADVSLSGWMGHQQPFAFDLDYKAADGISRMRIGTPPIIALSALEASLDIWEQVDINDVRAQSIMLSELFISEVEKRCPELSLFSPRDPNQRGSQVSFTADNGYAIMQALIAENVIGDFRQPNVVRFGFTPLYIDADDVLIATQKLRAILDKRLWDRAEYKIPKAVT